MPTLWDCLQPHKQDELKSWYQKCWRKSFRAPGRELHIEPIEQIDKIMRENREVKPK
jgi:hypothetical protein